MSSHPNALPLAAATSPAVEPTTVPPETELASLRRALDAVDDAVHDLLMRRAEIVGQIGGLGRSKVPFRPGREAAIIRRLLARHEGPLPRRLIARLWRELFAATTALQGRFTVTACEDGSDQLATLAREHFGALTPLRVFGSPAQAIAEVSAGRATAAVLPLPVEEESAHLAWWTTLLHRDDPRIHVVARLPFWAAPRPEGSATARALVVAANAPDPSGHDRALIGFELPPETSRARLAGTLAAAGFEASDILLRRDRAGGGHGLIEVAGTVADDDPRLGGLSRAVVLGHYAVPVEES